MRVGDTLTIKAFTKSGYVQSVNLKVYGTFTFQGLEKSPLAGELNMMDLVSFRELYGFLTDDKQAEIAALQGQRRRQGGHPRERRGRAVRQQGRRRRRAGRAAAAPSPPTPRPGVDADQRAGRVWPAGCSARSWPRGSTTPSSSSAAWC